MPLWDAADVSNFLSCYYTRKFSMVQVRYEKTAWPQCGDKKNAIIRYNNIGIFGLPKEKTQFYTW